MAQIPAKDLYCRLIPIYQQEAETGLEYNFYDKNQLKAAIFLENYTPFSYV